MNYRGSTIARAVTRNTAQAIALMTRNDKIFRRTSDHA